MSSKLTHRDVVESAYKWVLKNASCGVAFKELYTNACNGEYPDVIGFGRWGHSVLVECKISRNDFLADRKKHFRKYPDLGMGTLRYYACPTGLLKPEDVIPLNWGLLYVSETGRCQVVYKNIHEYKNESGNTYKAFYRHQKNIKAEHGLMYSALRILHLRGRIDEIYTSVTEENGDELLQTEKV